MISLFKVDRAARILGWARTTALVGSGGLSGASLEDLEFLIEAARRDEDSAIIVNRHSGVGTFKQRTIKANRDDLVRVFGQPLPGDDYKSDTEWVIEFGDTVVTVYDSYDEWRVGGFDEACVHVLFDFLRFRDVAFEDLGY